MSGGRILSAIIIAFLSIGLLGCHKLDKNTVAVLETTYGKIVLEFYPDQAPKTVANFQELVKAGFYDGTKFHRIVNPGPAPIAIQGGDPNTVSGDPSTWGQGQPGQKTVPAEFSNTLKHVRGTVSMARKTNDINSATSQFFICDRAQSQWDDPKNQYTIFGHVIAGMDVVDLIAHAPVWPNTERPMDPVVVKHAYLAKKSDIK
jgi:peptidyl-prolyl cis-trans isomerase B (cyclophilin B)